MSNAALQSEIDEFLSTGEYDLCFLNWPGDNVLAKMRNGTRAMQDALVAEVRRRDRDVTVPEPLAGLNAVQFARSKVKPMVRGLFPTREQKSVLACLERSLLFLTPDTIETVIREASFLDTARTAANVYLQSIGAEPFEKKQTVPVGFSVETTCFVSLTYFDEEDPLADYVVHEAAHVLHNTKRHSLALPTTQDQEWLLPIAFDLRETFAYGCEFYSRLTEHTTATDRRALVKAIQSVPDDRVDTEDFVAMLEESIRVPNGWQVILKRCSEKS